MPPCRSQLHAETYPSIRRASSSASRRRPQDITARLIAQWLSDHLGQQFLVESRAGAGGTLGAEYVVNSPPDGYTLLLAAAEHHRRHALRQAEVDFVSDIAHVAAISQVPLVAEVTRACR